MIEDHEPKKIIFIAIAAIPINLVCNTKVIRFHHISTWPIHDWKMLLRT